MSIMKPLVLVGICSILVGCGSATEALNATKGMPDLMSKLRSDTNNNMNITNQAIHKQTLVVALAEMLKPENTKYLNPPTGMMPAAEAFSAEATPEELAKLFHVYFREIQEVVPDDTMVQKTPDGKWTPDAIAFDQGKMVKVYAMMTIAGLAPQEKVEQLIQEQVSNAGAFEQDAYRFLVLRTQFIKTYLIEEDLIAYLLTNPGKFEDALKYLGQIDYVAKLPFADQAAIKTKGFLEQELNLNIVVKGGTDDTNVFGTDRTPVRLWRDVQRAFTTQLDPTFQKSTEPDMLSRLLSIKTQVDAGVANWKPQP